MKPSLSEPAPANRKIAEILRATGVPSAASAIAGRAMRVHGRSVTQGDVVLYKERYNEVRGGEVSFHAGCGFDIFTGISDWPVIEDSLRYKKARVRTECTVIRSACIQQAVTFSQAKVGCISTVLMPAV